MASASNTFENIEQQIYILRGQKVMLDSDLATLYGVSTKRLNEQVKRNLMRFPEDFMFQLTTEEVAEFLRSQFATSNTVRGGRRYLPYTFTEHGTVMLATILNSPSAISASIQIVKAFVRMRSILAAHKELAKKIDILERSTKSNFAEIYKFIHTYLVSKRQLTPAIGFRLDGRKR
jgi:phage regulator Rha-like protein